MVEMREIDGNKWKTLERCIKTEGQVQTNISFPNFLPATNPGAHGG